MREKFTINMVMIIVVLVLAISLFLMIKLQDNPVVFALTSNVMAGYIFYVVIAFIPRKMKERKASKLLHPQLVELKSSLEKLLGVAEGFITVDEHGKINFPIQEIYFFAGNVIWKEKTSDFILQYSKKVRTQLTQITQSPLFRDLDDYRAEVITSLQTSQFISRTLDSVANATEQDQNTIKYPGYRNGLDDLVSQYSKLYHEKLTKAREATFDEISIYNQRIMLNRQMYKNGEKYVSYIDGIGVQEL